jgi:hypothetical protein
VKAINDIAYNSLVAPGELSVSALTGKGRGGKGLIDLIFFKKELLEHLLTVKLDGLAMPAGAKSAVRRAMSSHKACREALGFAEAVGAGRPDLTWFGALPLVAQSLIRLIEAACPAAH